MCVKSKSTGQIEREREHKTVKNKRREMRRELPTLSAVTKLGLSVILRKPILNFGFGGYFCAT